MKQEFNQIKKESNESYATFAVRVQDSYDELIQHKVSVPIQEELALLILEVINWTDALENLIKEVNKNPERFEDMPIQQIVKEAEDEVNLYRDIRGYEIPPSRRSDYDKVH
jgi:hypothetical protein